MRDSLARARPVMMSQLPRIRRALRMTGAICAAALIPLGLVAWLAWRHSDQLLVEHARERLDFAARSQAAILHGRLVAADQVLREVAASVEWSAALGGALRGRVEEHFGFLGILYPDGALRTLSGEWRGLFELPQSVRPRLGAEQSALVVPPQQGARSRLFLVRAIPGRSPPDAVLVAELSWTSLWAMSDPEPGSAQMCVLNAGAGRIDCASGPDEVRVRELETVSASAPSGRFDWSDESGVRLSSYRRVPLQADYLAADWLLLASEPRERVLAPGAAFRWWLLLTFLGGVAVVAMVAARQASRTAAALDRLAHGARRLAHRDLSASASPAKDADYAELVESLDGIAGQLRKDLAVHEALAAIDRQLLQGPDLTRIAGLVAGGLRRVLDADVVGMALRSRSTPARGTLHIAAGREAGPVVESPVDFTPLFGEERLLAAPSMWLPGPIAGDPVLASVSERGARHLLVVAVACDRRLVGMLAVGFAQPPALTAHEEGYVRQFADRMAIAYAAALREEQLDYRLRFDTLTGLPNRQSFMERLGEEMERARRDGSLLALMLVDLDQFKQVNDALGHAAGDDVIRQARDRLKECARESDTLSRFGADEFALLLTGLTAPADAARVAARAVRTLGAPFLSGERERVLSASVGVALFPPHANSAEVLLRNADTAMHRAKEAGRGRVVLFEARMNEELQQRATIERELRRAIERDEFVLYYQPQMDVRTGDLSGAEVLIRWQHPERGLQAPAAFIAIAEQTGLIDPIGEMVLRKACMQLEAWRAQGVAPPRLSVNVSGRQFKRRDFAELVASILRETGCEPRFLELEITETLLMEDADASSVVLTQLAEQGIRLAIDDFGTGYSSLAYLKRLRFDALKIDRSFVKDVTTDEDSRAIASSIIALARTLRKETVAEGVETQEQLDFLRAERCDLIQGYLISKPVPAEDLLAALRVSLTRTRTVLRLATRA